MNNPKTLISSNNEVIVAGLNMEVGASLTSHAKEEVTKAVSKFFPNFSGAIVNFEKDKHHHKNIKVHITIDECTKKGILIKGDASARDPYAAFDEALVKIITRLRKYRDKLQTVGNKRNAKLAQKKVIDHFNFEHSFELIDGGLSEEFDDKYLQMEQSATNPVIIAEKTAEIQELSVSEAVMQMELANLPALTFVNKKTGNYNFIYFRKDGNISWVATE